MLHGSSRPTHPDSPAEVRPQLGIVGAGRVGHTLAQTLAASGYTISAVYSRTVSSAVRLANLVNARVSASAVETSQYARLIILAVPDQAIAEVCEALAQADLTGRAVVHTSGATPLSVLNPAKKRGALIGGLHPFLPVTGQANRIEPGVAFGLEADREPLRGWLSALVEAMGGFPLWLRPGLNRALYHAAAVLASNYLVTLFAEASGLLTSFVADEQAAQASLLGLMRAALDNIEREGANRALTGPIVRGDSMTVAAHLDNLQHVDPELETLYRLLGQRTLRIAAARGLTAESLAHLHEVLENHANDDSGHSEDETRRSAHPNGDSL